MAVSQALRSPVVQNLTAAATAGLISLARPARLPRWGRRVLRITNAVGSIGAVYLAGQENRPGGLHVGPLKGRASAASAGSALAIVTSGVSLMTSGLGVAADRKVEALLLRRGVRHPRLWIAVGVVGVVFAVKSLQDTATKRASETAQALVEQRRHPRPAAGPAADRVPGEADPAGRVPGEAGPAGRVPEEADPAGRVPEERSESGVSRPGDEPRHADQD